MKVLYGIITIIVFIIKTLRKTEPAEQEWDETIEQKHTPDRRFYD